MARLIGYARVSTVEQDLQLQLNALNMSTASRSFSSSPDGLHADHPKDARLASGRRSLSS